MSGTDVGNLIAISFMAVLLVIGSLAIYFNYQERKKNDKA